MAMASDSPFRSPLSYLENPSPSPSPPRPPESAAAAPSPSQVVTWASRTDPPPPEISTRAAEPPAAGAGGGSRSVASILRRDRTVAAVRTASVAVRVAAAVLCLISFSVMAADKNRGWTLDSFADYNEYRYCLTVNVIGFLYAGFQAFAEVHHKINKRHIINRPAGFYFDFAMDQILAYLLISASSSATSRTDYWVANWGNDPFPSMISGSVAISFLAFMAFAVSSLISAYKLFSFRNL